MQLGLRKQATSQACAVSSPGMGDKRYRDVTPSGKTASGISVRCQGSLNGQRGFSIWFSFRTVLSLLSLAIWWPKSWTGWRRFGLVVAYLFAFFFMRYAFDMK
jgi:hypothetical protein